MRGVLGGLMGGFVGGLLFNLVAAVIPSGPTDTGTASRFVAEIVVGICIGFLVAMVESVSKNAWLTALSGRREGAQFILSKDITLIGRDDRDDVILWGDPLLATRHARIQRFKVGYLLESLSAEALTAVNGQPINGTAPLHNGDEVMLGGTRLVFHTRNAPLPLPTPTRSRHALPTMSSAPPAPRPTHASSAAAPPSLLPPPTVPAAAPPSIGKPLAAFRLVELSATGRSYTLTSGTVTTFGRSADNAVVLDDAAVSGHHAEVREENGRWVVHDLDSTNGTYVSYGGATDVERRVEQNALKEGSVLRVGRARFRLARNRTEGSRHS